MKLVDLRSLVAPAIAIFAYILVQMFGSKLTEKVPVVEEWMANIVIGLVTLIGGSYFLKGYLRLIAIATGLGFAITGAVKFLSPHSPSKLSEALGLDKIDVIAYHKYQDVMR